MSAIRLARGYTGRDKILKFEGCYHGHADSLLVKAGSGLVTFGETTSAGVPETFARETLVAPRSEEQTSELQSLMRRSYAVFCLKKKKNKVWVTELEPHDTIRMTENGKRERL